MNPAQYIPVQHNSYLKSKYIVGLELVYSGGVAPSSAHFEVVQKTATDFLVSLIMILLLLILIIGIFIIFLIIRRKKRQEETKVQ